MMKSKLDCWVGAAIEEYEENAADFVVSFNIWL